jgi:hypothetical protein
MSGDEERKGGAQGERAQRSRASGATSDLAPEDDPWGARDGELEPGLGTPARQLLDEDPAGMRGGHAAPGSSTSEARPSSPPEATEEDDLARTKAIQTLPLAGRTRSSSGVSNRPARAPSSVGARGVLVVDEGERSGAQLASRLTARGHVCRVVSPAEVERALGEARYAAAIVDVPPDRAREPELSALLAPFEGWPGALILISAGPLPGERPRLASARRFVKPVLADELVAALAEASAPSSPPASSSSLSSPAPLEPSSARAAVPRSASVAPLEAADPRPPLVLDRVPVRAVLDVDVEHQGRALVRSLEFPGTLQLEARRPIPAATRVEVELVFLDGRRVPLHGRVARSGAGEMSVRLDLLEGDGALLERYLEQSQEQAPGARGPELIRIRPRGAPESKDEPDDAVLLARWQEASLDLDDQEAHQRFIQDCVRARRLEFAVQCYRNLQAVSPDDERVARYLQQVGTILGFYVLRKSNQGDADGAVKIPRTLKVGAIFLLVVGALLGLAAIFLQGWQAGR